MTRPCRHPEHDHGDRRAVVRIVPIRDVDADTTLQRRSLLQVGLSVAGAVAVLAACGPEDPAPAPTAPPSTTPPAPAAPPVVAVPPSSSSTTTRTRRTTTTTTPPADSGGYGGSSGGGTLREPCLPTKIPKGYTCTCNCVAE